MKIYIAEICENNYDVMSEILGAWQDRNKAIADLLIRFEGYKKFAGQAIIGNEDLAEIARNLPTTFKYDAYRIANFELVPTEDGFTVQGLEAYDGRVINFDVTISEYELNENYPCKYSRTIKINRL